MDQNIQLEYQTKKTKSLKKSIISMAAFIIATFAIFSAQTYAYFVDSIESEQNRIIAGNLATEIIETQNTDQGQVAYVNPVRIMPATEVSKIVKVQNTGSLPVYVRIKIEKTIDKSESEMSADWKDLITCNFKIDDESTEAIEGLWIYRDGYYYYSVSLAPGSTTSPLFDTVFFSADMGNEFTNSKIQFAVICQSTQANGNSSDPLTAVGWPSEPVDNIQQGNASDTTN